MNLHKVSLDAWLGVGIGFFIVIGLYYLFEGRSPSAKELNTLLGVCLFTLKLETGGLF